MKKFLGILFLSLLWCNNSNGEDDKILYSLKEGKKLVFIRHALAPGNCDPKNFDINDCSTQRNLDKIGIIQSKKIGLFFKNNKIKIDKVLSSEWCRCKDTAKYAFNTYETFNALNSFYEIRFMKNKTKQIKDLKEYIDNWKSKKNLVFKFNDLKSNVSFIAFRVEGDKISIEEKINNLKKELQLNNSDTSTLDVYQSEPFWKKINNLEVFEKTEHNLVRMVIPPANGSKLCKYLENQHSYYVDWCGSLFWIEVDSKKEEKIKYLKKMANDFGGYLTVIKTSSEYDYGEAIFTVDKVRLIISEKVKQSFDPKRILNPGKMYRGI